MNEEIRCLRNAFLWNGPWMGPGNGILEGHTMTPASDDPLAHTDLLDIDIRRDAYLLKRGLDDILSRSERFDGAVLIATACAFLEACDMAELDPIDAFAQIADLFDGGEILIEDDPAGGRWVHHEVGHA